MKESLIFTLQVAWHVAYMVIVPLFVFGGIGLYLDRLLGTLPWILLVGIALALISTIKWMSSQLKLIIEASVTELHSDKKVK